MSTMTVTKQAIEQNEKMRQAISRWPVDVAAAFLILDMRDKRFFMEGRKLPRTKYMVHAKLQLSGVEAGGRSVEVYTRDVSSWTVGFVSNDLLNIGQFGTLAIVGPDGEPLEVDCGIYRWRELIPGWFEAAAHFSKRQFAFGEYNMG